jgi:hypothetical protein
MKRVFAILLFAFTAAAQPKPFSVVEASIPDMQKALREKRVTSRELVLQYLVRIATYEDRLNAVIAVNPKAPTRRRVDRERKAGKSAAAARDLIALWQHPHDEHVDDGGALAPKVCPAVRSDADEEPLRRGRDHHREDSADRAGQLGGHGHAYQLQLAGRLRVQPVRSATRPARSDL